jgi:hypothetical protein
LNESNITIGNTLTIFSSTDFKIDRIAPESSDYSISVSSSGSLIHLNFLMATDDQSITSTLQYAVVMSAYSLTCVDTISHIAGNITPCDNMIHGIRKALIIFSFSIIQVINEFILFFLTFTT